MWDVILLSRNRFYYGCCLRRSLTDAEYPQLLNSITTFIPRQLPLAWQMRTQGTPTTVCRGTPTTVCRGHMHCLPAPSPAAAGRGTLWHQKTVQWKPYNFAISCILHCITGGRTTVKLLSLFTPLTAKWIYLKSLFFFFPSVNSEKLWHRVKCIRFHPSLVPIPAPSWEPLLWLRAEGLRLWWIKHSKLQSTHTQTDKENYKYRTGHYGESRDQVHKTGEK